MARKPYMFSEPLEKIFASSCLRIAKELFKGQRETTIEFFVYHPDAEQFYRVFARRRMNQIIEIEAKPDESTP